MPFDGNCEPRWRLANFQQSRAPGLARNREQILSNQYSFQRHWAAQHGHGYTRAMTLGSLHRPLSSASMIMARPPAHSSCALATVLQSGWPGKELELGPLTLKFRFVSLCWPLNVFCLDDASRPAPPQLSPARSTIYDRALTRRYLMSKVNESRRNN